MKKINPVFRVKEMIERLQKIDGDAMICVLKHSGNKKFSLSEMLFITDVGYDGAFCSVHCDVSDDEEKEDEKK